MKEQTTINTRPANVQRVEAAIRATSSTVKVYCGIANNVARLVMGNAIDELRTMPEFRHKVKHEFGRAMQMWDAYERKLLHATQVRFFHVDDLSDDARKAFGNITDAEYFEFWQGLAGKMYADTEKYMVALRYKYAASLERHGETNAKAKAWAMVAQVCLEFCKHEYYEARKAAAKYGVPERIFDTFFGVFSVAEIAKIWRRALDMIVGDYDLELQEDRNIHSSIKQLWEEWRKPENTFATLQSGYENFAEVFRTKGELKKQLRRIGDIAAEVQDEIKKEKINELKRKSQ